MARSFILSLAFATIACAEPGAPPAADKPIPTEGDAPAPADDVVARGRAAGLSAAQAETLAGYGAGAVVPILPEDWTLSRFVDETIDEGPGAVYPGYSLHYARADDACFEIHAASEGIGDVFTLEPPHMAEATAPQLALHGPIPVGWSTTDEPESDWGAGRLNTEWFGTDGVFFHLASVAGDGCSSLPLSEAQDLISDLRYLDPADDATLPGYWIPMEVMEEGGDLSAYTGSDAESIARTMSPAGDATSTRVETLRAGPTRRLVVVTHEGLMDDSIRDERVRISFMLNQDGQWFPLYVARQQRCHDGRGHTDWGPDACI